MRKREEFLSADSGAQGPEGSKRAYLKHREQDLRLDEKINKVQVSQSVRKGVGSVLEFLQVDAGHGRNPIDP